MLSSRLAVLPQYLLPKQALTELAGRLARHQGGTLTTAVIRWFIRHYRVNMAEALHPDPAAYATFNEFFTRALRSDARPLADAHWLCPVDGTISQLGHLTGDGGDRILQAKHHHYSTQALLGGDAALAVPFAHGQFVTIYLSPRDYHRIHMPCTARLRRMVYVPGALFSVNPTTARGVPGLFARNERVVCIFDGEHGPLALVLVGATIVGSMATVWHGTVNPPRPGHVQQWNYDGQDITLTRGQEMGRFLLGSTVVLLMPPSADGNPALQFNPVWQAGTIVQMGEKMAAASPPTPTVLT